MRANSGAGARVGRQVLRRASWPVLTWGGIVILWLMFPFVVRSLLYHDNVRDVWGLTAVLCAVTALLRRIGSCRVVLLPESVQVDNLVTTHQIPHSAVRDVVTTPGGGLEVQTLEGSSVHSFAFGGSIVDAYFKTSARAALEVAETAVKASKSSEKEGGEATRKVRGCWSADIPLLFAVVFLIVALVTAS